MKLSGDLAQLDEHFEMLRHRSKDGASIEILLEGIKRLIELRPVSIGSVCASGTELYRATCHHAAAPQSIEQLWFPPPEKVTELGRANRPGHSVFYCSSDPSGAVAELRPRLGQMIVLAKWVTTKSMKLHDLGYTAEVLAQSGCRRELPARHKQFYDEQLDPVGKRIRDFIASTFVNPSRELYPLTIAIAEFHMNSHVINGILYPSVSRNSSVDNIALKPDFVRTSLQVQSAQLFRLDELRDDGSLSGSRFSEFQHVTSLGQIRWSFSGPARSIPPNHGYGLEIGKTVLVQDGGLLDCLGSRYEVQSGYSIEATVSGLVVRDLRGEIVAPLIKGEV